MFIKYTDCGVRFHRPKNTNKDVAAYFMRSLVVHKGENKLVSAWDSTKEGVRVKYEQEIKKLEN